VPSGGLRTSRILPEARTLPTAEQQLDHRACAWVVQFRPENFVGIVAQLGRSAQESDFCRIVPYVSSIASS
jgi:hypothetical protein